jgi:hypothetical protein
MTAKEVTSIRIDPELVKKALEMGLVLSEVMKSALEKAVKEKKCPACGQKLKK